MVPPAPAFSINSRMKAPFEGCSRPLFPRDIPQSMTSQEPHPIADPHLVKSRSASYFSWKLRWATLSSLVLSFSSLSLQQQQGHGGQAKIPSGIFLGRLNWFFFLVKEGFYSGIFRNLHIKCFGGRHHQLKVVQGNPPLL